MTETKRNKYTYGDVVRFHIDDDRIREGSVEIVDRYGTFERPGEPSYDIFIKEDNLLLTSSTRPRSWDSLDSPGIT